MAHFALVPISHVESEEEDNMTGPPEPQSLSQNGSTTALRQDITLIYESYANLYPNPALIQERQERDALLRALRAAEDQEERSQSQRQNKTGEKPKSWFGLFSSGSEKVKQTSASRKNDHNPYDDDEDDRLLYSDLIDEDDDLTDPMCGTQRGLEFSCIPREAHLQARFCLASQKAHSPMNLARNCPSDVLGSSSTIMVVGLGAVVEIAERRTTTIGSDKDSSHWEPQLQYTSDRAALLQHISNQEWTFNAEQARAAVVGPNLLCVSWGLIDGLVVLYRRTTANPALATASNEVVVWQSVAISSPSPQVLSCVQDELMLDEDQEEGRQEMTSPLLLVTDVLPLVLDVSGDDDGYDSKEQSSLPPPFLTLAISRLGGYIELVPIPAQFWLGPPVEGRPSSKKSVHYAARLPNLSHGGGDRVLAMTTAQYHNDVLGLSAFATRVAGKQQSTHHSMGDRWNQEMYPDHPPAQYVLSAHGTMDETERLSFWCVGFVPLGKQDDPLGYSLHSSVLEALDIGVLGPPLSIFATKKILRFWRKAKGLELAPNITSSSSATATISTAPDQQQSSSSLFPITTISVASPIVRVEYCVSGQAALLVLLDANGGVTYMECARLERLASQTLTDAEYGAIFESREQHSLPLVETLFDRSQVREWLRDPAHQTEHGDGVVSIQFLPRDLVGPFDNKPSLAMIDAGSNSLYLCSVSDLESQTSPLAIPFSTRNNFGYPVLHSVPQRGLQVIGSTRNPAHGGTLSVADACYYVHSLEQLNSSAIVRSLESSGKLHEALDAANQLGAQERESISSTVESLKKRLWEHEFNLLALKSIADDSYIVVQALRMCQPQSEFAVPDDIEDYRSMIALALERLSCARLPATVSLGGTESAEQAKSKLQSTLLQLGTYELLCRLLGGEVERSSGHFLTSFLVGAISDLANQFADNGDMAGLSLLVLRHWRELVFESGTGSSEKKLEWIQRIPPTMHPREYAHLLPVVREGGDDATSTVLFFATSEKLERMEQMPKYLLGRFAVSTVLDDESDRKTLFASIAESFHSVESRESLAISINEACARRARMIEQYSSSIGISYEFSKIDAVSYSLGAAAECDSQLKALSKKVEAVRNALSNSPNSRGTVLPKSMAVVATRLESNVTVRGILSSLLRLDGETDTDMVRALDALRPLLSFLDGGDGRLPFELTSFCLQAISVPPTRDGLPKLLRGICLCSAVATLSRTSLPRAERLIEDKLALGTFVDNAINQSFVLIGMLSLADLDPGAISKLVHFCWSLYESLPVKILGVEETKEETSEMMNFADKLFPLLVATDIAAAWGDHANIRLCADALTTKDTSRITQSFAVSLCESCFCQIVDINQSSQENPSTCVGILDSLFSDIAELAGLFTFDEGPTTLTTKHVVIPLLKAGKLELLAMIASRTGENLFDAVMASDEIGRYVEDEIVLCRDRSPNIQFFEDCRDLLGGSLPTLKSRFDALKIFVDASTRFNSLPRRGDPRILPRDIKELGGTEVIELLLKRNPQNIVFGCDEWADEASSSILNNAIREITQQGEQGRNQENNSHLPRLPGQEVFVLAEILGLVKDVEVIVVKCLVASYARLAGYYGACAALCRNLLVTDLAWAQVRSSAIECTVLGEVCAIVSCEEYTDGATRRELSELVLSFSWQEIYPDYNKILDVWTALEYGGLSKSNNTSSFGRFHAETVNHYSVDIYSLFALLSQKALDGPHTEKFLETLSTYSILWSTVVESGTNWDGPDKLLDIGDIGIWLLFHLQDKAAASSVLDDLIDKTTAEVDRATALYTSHVNANRNIVELLQQHGYSRNGAVRAAISAPNMDANQALQWAVMHSMDSDFNMPLLRLKPPGPTKQQMQYLTDMLHFLQQTRQGLMDVDRDSLSRLLASRDNLALSGYGPKSANDSSVLNAPNPLSSGSKHDDDDEPGTSFHIGHERSTQEIRSNTPDEQNPSNLIIEARVRSDDIKSPAIPVHLEGERKKSIPSVTDSAVRPPSEPTTFARELDQLLPPPHTDVTAEKPTDAVHTEALDVTAEKPTHAVQTSGSDILEARSLDFSGGMLPPEKPREQKSHETKDEAASVPTLAMPAFVTQSAPPSLGSPFGRSPRRSSPAKLSPSERNSFRQRGQDFLKRMRNNVRNKGNMDRQRLIDQGRQLLQRSRTESTTDEPVSQTLLSASSQLEAIAKSSGTEEGSSRGDINHAGHKGSSSPVSVADRKSLVERARALKSGEKQHSLADRGRQLLEQARASKLRSKTKKDQDQTSQLQAQTTKEPPNKETPIKGLGSYKNERVERDQQGTGQTEAGLALLHNTAPEQRDRDQLPHLTPAQARTSRADQQSLLTLDETEGWEFDDEGALEVEDGRASNIQVEQVGRKLVDSFAAASEKVATDDSFVVSKGVSKDSNSSVTQLVTAVEENGWEFDEDIDAEAPPQASPMENSEDGCGWDFDDGLGESNEEETNGAKVDSSLIPATKLNDVPQHPASTVVSESPTVDAGVLDKTAGVLDGSGNDGWDFEEEDQSAVAVDDMEQIPVVDASNSNRVNGEMGWSFDDEDETDGIDLC